MHPTGTPTGTEQWHGTTGGYTNHHCRCDGCRAAFSAYNKAARLRRHAQPTPDHVHGTKNGYFGYGCRCEECRRAARPQASRRNKPRRSREEIDADNRRKAVAREERAAKRAAISEIELRLLSESHVPVRTLSFEDRYMINEITGCWEWTGTLYNGYGSYRGMNAHRWSYIAAGHEVPAGYHVDHLCRNRACVNPEHLEAVTPRENFMRGANKNALTLREGFCRRGHPFEGDNVRVRQHDPRKAQECVQCNRDRCKRYRAKRKTRQVGETA